MSRTAREEGLTLQLKWPRFPFPGLRPFRETPDADESLIFYGRNKQKDDILRRLDSAQFVSIVGPSGCGKSSLVKVGVIHALTAGLLTRAGWNWRVVEMRPGAEPLVSLAAALAILGGRFDPAYGTAEHQIREVLSAERSGLWVLMDFLAPTLARDANLARPTRVLLLIDQFEEVFSGSLDQRVVNQFIGLVSEFFRKPHPQLYIVLTMRTDFIGQCANFPGLAEILNDTQYITPVLRGQDLRDAITCPAEAYHGEIEPALVTELVRDMGSGAGYDADHLPLMQHALLWLWQHARAEAGIAEPPGPQADWPADRPMVRLTVDDYRRNGGLSGILNRHADDIFRHIEEGPDGPARARIIEAMFRHMTERDASARYNRTPILASEICALTECTPQELHTAIEPFCGIGTSFVERRPTDRPDDPLLDLSHESLIRQWRRLRDWADDEARKLHMFRRFADDAKTWDLYGRSRKYLRRGTQLSLMRDWWAEHRPTARWARRYQVAEGSTEMLSDSFPIVDAYRHASMHAEWVSRVFGWFMPPILVLGLAALIVFSLVRENYATVRGRNNAIERAALVMGQDELEHGHATRALEIAVMLLKHNNEFPEVPRAERLAYEALEELRQVSVQKVQQPLTQRWTTDLSPGGRQILSASNDAITIMDIASRRPLLVGLPSLDELSVADTQWGVRLSPDGGHVLLWAKERAFVLPMNLGAPPRAIGSAEMHPLLVEGKGIGGGFFSADGTRVFAWRDNRVVYIWNAASGERVGKEFSLNIAASFGAQPALNAGGTMFAEPTMLGVTVYDVTTGKGHNLPIGGQDGQNSIAGARPPPVAFHPAKPELLAIVSGSTVELWNPEDTTHKQASWRSPQHVDASEIAQVAFSQNGNYIAVWGTFGARILSADTGDAVAFLGDHESGVSALRFDPDGRRVATVGRDRDHTLRIWTLEAALPVQNVKTDPIPAPGGRPRPQPGAESTPPSFTLGDGRLRIEVVQAPPGGDTRAHRDAAGEAASLLVYRRAEDQEPVAALHGPWRRNAAWLSVRLDRDGNVVGLANDGNQYTWRYFANRDALLSFAEDKLDQLRDHSKESAADLEPTASEGCLLEPVGGNCSLGKPENP